MTRVSVVIPAHNCSRFIADSVQSALNQTIQDTQIIVVDDCSTDDTPGVLGHLDDPRLTIMRTDVNVGPAGARNAGVRRAQGDFIAFLDADDMWVPTNLEQQLALYRAMSLGDAAEGVIYSAAELVDETGGRLRRWIWDQGRLKCGDVFVSLLAGNFVPTSSVLMRRRLVEEAGGFASDLRHAEDYDLWLRLARKYAFYPVMDALVLYRLRSGSLTQQRFRMRAGHVEALLRARSLLQSERERRAWLRHFAFRSAVAVVTRGSVADKVRFLRGLPRVYAASKRGRCEKW